MHGSKIISTAFRQFQKAGAPLVRDDRGFVVSMELILTSTICVLGLMVSFAAFRDSLTSELSDVTGAVQDLNMSFSILGINSPNGSTNGSGFTDQLDFCDSAEDVAGEIDNCIQLSEPIDGGEPVPPPTGGGPVKTWLVSDPDSLNPTSSTAGSATGTIGAGGITSNFDVTTDTGRILGTSGSNIRFSEDPDDSGRYTIEFEKPIVDFEFFVDDFTNIFGQSENLLGNFTLELSDGSVFNNAAFNVVPDAISQNSTYGEFSTGPRSVDRLVPVNRGGLDYVTDPTIDGSLRQAGGRIVFPDVPAFSGTPGPGTIGVQSLSFEKRGGPNNFGAVFNASGRVIDCEVED